MRAIVHDAVAIKNQFSNLISIKRANSTQCQLYCAFAFEWKLCSDAHNSNKLCKTDLLIYLDISLEYIMPYIDDVCFWICFRSPTIIMFMRMPFGVWFRNEQIYYLLEYAYFVHVISVMYLHSLHLYVLHVSWWN